MLHHKALHHLSLRQNIFEEFAQSGEIQLTVAQIVDLPTHGLLGCNLERDVGRKHGWPRQLANHCPRDTLPQY